ncbi:hypothetical protein [Polaromonas sp.]|uniref:hypothetical protein n=1 Tax=Polaromonas sp. TaxID=1869339 RepID=UPI00248A2823|nr:hypothetical protein [Polaromonas sp.]MDI1339349.1 hypothetical protein [Polaromonas sp.]
MSDRTIRITKLDDFLQVPAEDLSKCLKAFRDKLEQIKLNRADAQRLGKQTVIPFESFNWMPHAVADIPTSGFRPDTPLAELGLRPSAVHHLREMQIYCLEDCSEASQSELLRTPDIGRATVLRIRELLISVGLDFRESSHPVVAAYDRLRLFQKEPLVNRKGKIDDSSDVAELGLRTSTFSLCLKHKLQTVGDLRALSLRDYYIKFGSASRLEIATTLRALELPFHCNPSDLELWRGGMLLREEMTFPADDAAVGQLRPWIGACVEAFDAAGLTTVRALKLALKGGRGRVRGVGQSSLERVLQVMRPMM